MKMKTGIPGVRRPRVVGFLGVTAALALPQLELQAAELFGRVVECRSGVSPAGYLVRGFEVVRVAERLGGPCSRGSFQSVTRDVGTDTTDEAGSYSISYTATEESAVQCIADRMAFIQVFLPDGETLFYTSPQKSGGGIGFLDRAFEDVALQGSNNMCPEPRFTFSFSGPSEVTGPPGSTVSFEVTVLLGTEFGQTPSDHGAEGWAVNVAAEGGTVTSATTAGTLAAKVTETPPGLVCPSGTRLMELQTANGNSECANLKFANSGVSICPAANPPVGLPLEAVLPGILRVTVAATIPDQAAPGVCRVFFPELCDYGDGGGVRRKTFAVFRATAIDPVDRRELLVTLRAGSSGQPTLFRRADANGSGEVDISDAVNTFGFLFLGDKQPLCLSAADSNGDETIDISDGVNTLGYLFGGGKTIPLPGPQTCGMAPGEPTLGCASYGGCD